MTIESQIAELKRQIEVMQAYERGEAIELIVLHMGAAKWVSVCEPPSFDWNHFDYRVKPKKREVWLRENDSISWWGGTLHQQKAMQQVEPNSHGAIRFVEAD